MKVIENKEHCKPEGKPIPHYENPPADLDLQRTGLTSADCLKLRDSFITPALAVAAQLRRVDSFEGAETVGRKSDAYHNYAGIRFSFFWPDNPNPREYSLKRDEPDEEMRPDGELKERGKYMGPPGRSSLFYFPPDVESQWLDDVSMPIVFVEGEKKALAMWRVACLLTGADRPIFVPIGLRGVWGWKRQKLYGERKRSEPIPDFERIAWTGRKVIILYDSNTHTHTDVQAARDNLGAHLKGLDAEVLIAEMPRECNLNGPDDLLGTIERMDGSMAAATAIKSILDLAQPAFSKEEIRERYVLRDWQVMSDLANLMMSQWEWDDIDRVTYSAINSSWGGRAAKVFRMFLIVLFQRMQRLSDIPTHSEKKQAERFVRDRIKKLKATIRRTVDFPLLETSPGGQVDPKTGKRLGSEFRVNHKPFLEAYRLYLELVEKGNNPGQAREEAAKTIARRYSVTAATAAERDRQRAELEVVKPKDDPDARALQVAFEKSLYKKAEAVRVKMAEEGFTQAEIEIYFRQLGTQLGEIGQKCKKNKRLKKQEVKPVLGTMERTQNQTVPKAADVPIEASSLSSTSPHDMYIGNNADEGMLPIRAENEPGELDSSCRDGYLMQSREAEEPSAFVVERVASTLKPVEHSPPLLSFTLCKECGARLEIGESSCSGCGAPVPLVHDYTDREKFHPSD